MSEQKKRNRIESYKGNVKLKQIGEIIDYTEYEAQEFLKCAADPIYFIKNYVYIVHLDLGLVKFDLWPFQEELIRSFNEDRHHIVRYPRQSGKSTTTIAYFLWCILFKEEYVIAILANKGSLARELLGRVRKAYENLPKWLQQGIVQWNRGNIELENGSKIFAYATSADGVRGGSFNCILLDEFAHVQHNMALDFFQSTYPVISSGKTTKVIIVSTPKGLNLFYKMWVDAEEGRSNYVPHLVHWSQVPGRDEAWKEETIRNTSEEQFRVEFECLDGDSIVEIYDKKTKEEYRVKIKDLYEILGDNV